MYRKSVKFTEKSVKFTEKVYILEKTCKFYRKTRKFYRKKIKFYRKKCTNEKKGIAYVALTHIHKNVDHRYNDTCMCQVLL